jgi:maltokinase
MASKTPPSERLAEWLGHQRWFATKTRRIESITIVDVLPLASAAIAIVEVGLAGGAIDRYVVALGRVARAASAEITDGFDDPVFCRALLDVIRDGRHVEGESGVLEAVPTTGFPALLAPGLAVHRVDGEQSNTSVVFGEVAIMKTFRRLAGGINPEAEMTRFLTEHARFAHAPRLFGQLEYRHRDGSAATLAVVQELIPGARDGWEWLLDELRAGRAALDAIRRLGEVTGRLHRALAGRPDVPEFAPEPITDADLTAWNADVRDQLERAHTALGDARSGPPWPDLTEALAGLRGLQKIRHHGDLHFGQTLRRADGDWMIIDFEGEPLRPLTERRRKHTPLRDVAGIVRSLAYGAASVHCAGGETWLDRWQRDAADAFLGGYRAVTSGAGFTPASETAFRRALAVFEVEKAAYEIVYEANNRPDWIAIPRRGLVSAAERLGLPWAGVA